MNPTLREASAVTSITKAASAFVPVGLEKMVELFNAAEHTVVY